MGYASGNGRFERTARKGGERLQPREPAASGRARSVRPVWSRRTAPVRVLTWPFGLVTLVGPARWDVPVVETGEEDQKPGGNVGLLVFWRC
jgi:hypothetical protein